MSEPKTILLADDEEALHKVLGKRLQLWGFQVLPAMDGQEAVQLAKTQHPDLILLDVMMPTLNGLDAAHQLKQDPATSRIPIILVTAKARQLSQEQIQASGACAVVQKPYDADQLLRLIQQALGT